MKPAQFDARMQASRILTEKRNRAWRTFINRTTELARQAHPETDGSEHLVHNWGNEEARRIWREGWSRWHAYSKANEARYRAIWGR